MCKRMRNGIAKTKLVFLVIIVMIIFSYISMPILVYGLSFNERVNVTIPKFTVKLNGTVINNNYCEFPFIIYKGITYFPMTYNDCRYLGIETEWKDAKNGLLINSTGISAAYNPEIRDIKNFGKYTAEVVKFPIIVNGKSVNNSSEDYPLLLFRNVTYFPMTWKWCVEEFEWNYSYNNVEGLIINSSNKKVENIASLNSCNVDINHNPVISNGNIFFIGNDSKLYQTQIENTSNFKCIFNMPMCDLYVSLVNIDGRCFMNYGNGGFMGMSWLVEISGTGNIRYICSDSYNYGLCKDNLYKCLVKTNINGGNLFESNLNTEFINYTKFTMDHDNSNKFIYENLPLEKKIGDELYYECLVHDNSPNTKIISINNNKIYVVAVDLKEEEHISNLYAVDLSTNKSYKVNQNNIDSNYVAVEDGSYYYVSEGTVYRGDISNSDIVEISIGNLNGYVENCVANPFVIFGGKAYWKDISSKGCLYVTGNDDCLNYGAKLMKMEVIGEKNQYLACYFNEELTSKYRLIIYDKKGNIVFKTSDVVTVTSINDDTIYYYNKKLNMICRVIL